MEEIRLWAESLMQSSGVSTSGAVYITDAILVVLTLLLSWIAFTVCHRLLVPITVKITEKTDMKWDDVLFNEYTLRKACLIVPAIVVWMFIPHIFFRSPEIEEILERITAIYITLTSTKLALEVVNSIKLLDVDERSAHHQYLHTFCGVLKIVVWFLSVIVIVAIIVNRNPLTLLAGLGATSAILMLVFQDTIKGLVAGIRLTSNDMLHKGDWITVPKAGIDGNVEDMTLTTVKVRNFDNTIVTITPQTLVDESFQNWIGMQQSEGRRVKRKIYFDFNSIQILDEEMCKSIQKAGFCYPNKPLPGMVNLTVFRAAMEHFLRNHDFVNGDMLLMVRQLEPTNTGLPVEFYFFLKDKEWVTYEHNLAQIMEEIFADLHIFGLKIYQYNGAAPLQ